MRWSELKTRFEEHFADSVRGRVEVFVTRYRRAHDGAGEAWVTLDGEWIAAMGEIAYRKARVPLERRWRNAAPGRNVQGVVLQELRVQGAFSDEDFKRALFDYLGLSIEVIFAHPDPLVRAFGWLDRRCGKRRLARFDPRGEPALARRLFAFRCAAEDVRPAPEDRTGPTPLRLV